MNNFYVGQVFEKIEDGNIYFPVGCVVKIEVVYDKSLEYINTENNEKGGFLKLSFLRRYKEIITSFENE